MIKTKVAFLKYRLLYSQLEQPKKFSKSSDRLEKSRPSKKPTFVLIMLTNYNGRGIKGLTQGHNTQQANLPAFPTLFH